MIVRPLGDAAVLADLGPAPPDEAGPRVRALERALWTVPFRGLGETVPAYASLLVTFDPKLARPAEVERILRDALRAADDTTGPAPVLHEIPAVYGGGHGPDLEEVARRVGLSAAEVAARHAGREYTVAFLGFAPGFAYLGPLPGELELPRRATPRTRVPAGSIAIAGRQTAVYPAATAGGWHLIGATPAVLFDPRKEPPARLAPGDRVRFVPVAAADSPSPERATQAARDGALDAIEVLDPGLLTTVQDGGRSGLRRLGVAWCGAVDAPALAGANTAVGNAEGAAGLECTAQGPALRFLADTRFSVTGGDLGAVLERADLGLWPVPPGLAVRARPGNVLRFTGRRSGFRAYVAFAGGLDVPLVLGSRSTDLTGGFGGMHGRPLRRGDRLACADRPVGPPPAPFAPAASPSPAEVTLRVARGPQADLFADGAFGALLAATFTVGASSDRVACRLDGPVLSLRRSGDILTEGMLPGCIQVPPDGRAIVMLADCPTTGGYPKIATVLRDDLPLLGQLVPGEGRVRFTCV